MNLFSEDKTHRQVANLERRRMPTGIWWGNLKESVQMEQLGVYGRITWTWIVKEWGQATWNG
jgi:hypothetical protein